jgi:squalene-hopene/tetraprenyl-beta-curcumene cyclase
MTCYLVETATTLLGLRAVGEDMRSAYVERAAAFLASHQNADGGFGERAEVYRDPAKAGCGPSMAPVTGFVLLGLIAAGTAPPDVLARAADYLVRHQNAEGTWDNEGWLHTVNPPDSFYTYDLPARALPLLALARYRTLTRAFTSESAR